ncbi:DcaP family trimeric outer membrane transporter [Moraxella sp. ZY210820]|uniref:DcaP family trimeric outer membrane transporter n=1 Tax=unclassified Moraxella TaxID=2685852 RepID=UPI0027302B92|nr:DcaP family trimeric outer membrane transporter [Moraxella sp. ZY210820]WLF84642.1 porin [Moraxella sp. ZY210820]
MKLKTVTFVFACMATTTMVQASNVDPEELRQLREEIQALKAVVEQKQQQQVKYQLQNAPKLNTKNGAEVKLYGFVRADAGIKLDGTSNTWNNIAEANTGNDDVKLNTSMATTRLGFEFKTPTKGGHLVGGKLEGDFRGGSNSENGNGFRVRHAYVTYNDVLVGQTWSVFNDLDVLPNILDDNLIAGQGADRTLQIRYETKVAPQTKVAVALERNKNYNRVPNLTARVQQKMAGDKVHVSARSFVGEAHDSNASNDKKLTWGVAVGAAYNVNDNLTLMGDYNHIKGNQQYLEQTNTPYTVNANGKLTLSEFDAVSLGANYKFTPKVSGTTGVGYIKAKDNGVGTNREIKQGFTNVVYSPVEPLSFGVEYLYGEATTFADTKAKDQRVGLSATYNF